MAVGRGSSGRALRVLSWTIALVWVENSSLIACNGGSANEDSTAAMNGGASNGGVRAFGGAAGAASDSEGGAMAVEGGACLPSALADLVTGCPTIGECAYALDESGHIDVCYDNGVRTELVPKLDTSTTYVNDADGRRCFTLERSSASGADSAIYDYTWFDADDVSVATGRLDTSEPNTLIVNLDDARYRVQLDSPACVGVSALPRETGRCRMGACSF